MPQCLLRLACGAPLVILKTPSPWPCASEEPAGGWIVASVRLSVGLKGKKSSSLKAAVWRGGSSSSGSSSGRVVVRGLLDRLANL